MDIELNHQGPKELETCHTKCSFKHLHYRNGDGMNRSDTRNIILIVATLIASVTFQAGVNPPGGVWQDTKSGRHGHQAGTAIYAAQKYAFYVFLSSNTLALSTSVLVILSLTHKFPFQLEIFVASMSMIATHASAIVAVTPDDESYHFRYVLTAAALPLAFRLALHLYYKIRDAIGGALVTCDLCGGR